MTLLPSPGSFLPDGALGLIRDAASAAERARDLAPAVLELIYREGWFRLLAPRRWGGRALPLPELVRLEEGLAYADGSVGWVVTLCSGAGWFAGFIPDGDPGHELTEGFEGLFANERLCIAGSGSVGGEAGVVDGGYRVSGSWAYASGIRHATAYTANCRVVREREAVNGADGQPLIRPFLFLPGEVRLRNDWNAMGLVATGSHGFFMEDAFVPAERMFAIDPAAAVDADPLYQYPFLPLAEATLAVNISGMGQHFLECCADYFGRRELPEAERLLADARVELDALRGELYRVVDRSWVERSPELYAAVGKVSHEMASKVRAWAGRLYPFAGLGAARLDTTINRVWRDLYTAGQHPLLVF